jgi:ubiquinone biosynthesis protein
VADVAGAAPPERIERALARLMADNIRATGTIEPTVLQDLVSTLAQFGVRLPADLVILSRALITLDGTLRVLSPGISLVPAVTELMTSPTSPPILDREALLRDEIMSALPRLRRLPDQVDRILSLTGRGDLRVRNVVDEDGQRILRTLVNRALLTAIGFAFLVLSGILLVASEEGPKVASGTGLFEILGYGALLSGTVLVLRVVTAVARDGTT